MDVKNFYYISNWNCSAILQVILDCQGGALELFQENIKIVAIIEFLNSIPVLMKDKYLILTL